MVWSGPGVSGGEHRRRNRGRRSSVFESLLDEVMGSGIGAVVEAGKRIAPKCSVCGAPTVLACHACGRHACQAHAFINAQELSWEKISVTVICSPCISSNYSFVRIEPPAHIKMLLKEWSLAKYPWEILELSWNATEDMVNAQYKAMALKMHPDVGGSHKDMSDLSEARRWMIQNRRE